MAPPPPKWIAPAEWALVAASAALRWFGLAAFSSTPRADHPMVDAHTYWSQAQALMAGKDPFAEGYYQPPAYPWLLSKLAALQGGELALADVRHVHLVLGVITTALVVRLGRKVGARHGLAWAGLLAGALHALYPTVLLFEHDLLTPAVTGAAFTGALALLWPGEHCGLPAAWRAGLGGLLLGVAVAVHPTYLLAAGVLGLWLAVAGWRAGRRWLPAAALVVGVAAPIAPTAKENWDRFGVVELVSHNAGVNLYLGNNPDWVETTLLRPGLPFRQLVLEAEPHRRDAPARNDYWKSRTFAAIANDPGTWLATLGAKAVWSLSDTEVPRNEDYRCRTRDGEALHWLGRLPVRYGWAGPLGILGLLVLVRRARPAEERMLLPLWLALHAPMVIFLVSDRYRLATWPLLCVSAPIAVQLAREAVAAARMRSRPPLALLALVPLLLAAWWPIHWRTRMDPSLCRYAEGNIHYMEKEYAEAQAAYEDVLDTWPRDMGAHYWLAHLGALRKDHGAAVTHIEVVLDQFPDHFPSLKSLGGWALKTGDKARAVRAYEAAYRVPGDRTATGVRLVLLLLDLGRVSEARELVQADEKLARHRKLRDRPELR
jgi:tetratricopeptide (TPR) repeat protein